VIQQHCAEVSSCCCVNVTCGHEVL